ncbi:hypothetical protein WMY93_033610 [Mugilogobius chulae]|uniref:Niban 1/2/3 domain-containing protein n=1 Tax=Mugilogobius chulae TaxID=88201 RepID=A0AAW0MKN7_9GOBI
MFSSCSPLLHNFSLIFRGAAFLSEDSAVPDLSFYSCPPHVLLTFSSCSPPHILGFSLSLSSSRTRLSEGPAVPGLSFSSCSPLLLFSTASVSSPAEALYSQKVQPYLVLVPPHVLLLCLLFSTASVSSPAELLFSQKFLLCLFSTASVSGPAEALYSQKVQPYLASVLEELMDPISRGFSQGRELCAGMMEQVGEEVLQGAELETVKKVTAAGAELETVKKVTSVRGRSYRQGAELETRGGARDHQEGNEC